MKQGQLKLMKDGYEAIAYSSSIDFKDVLAWGQWCRDVAWAVRRGDREEFNRLASLSKRPVDAVAQLVAPDRLG